MEPSSFLIAPIWTFWVDSAHRLIGHAVVGGILGWWR